MPSDSGSGGNSWTIAIAALLSFLGVALSAVLRYLPVRKKTKEEESVGVATIYLGGAKDLLDRYTHDIVARDETIRRLELEIRRLETELQQVRMALVSERDVAARRLDLLTEREPGGESE